MSFRITGLSPDAFRPLFDLPDDALERIGGRRLIADNPRMPCRVSLAEAEPGEEVLLLNHVHQAANTPYRAAHAIYVRRAADRAFDAVDVLPEVMRSRLVALRAFDADDMMIDADVAEGDLQLELIERFLADPKARYLQAHYARRGCYAARIDRA